ncbi:MAG: MFS transporter [Acidimicrobiia bacterium]|nr:MFS transporter [Acidimicrobiia bacterium]MYG56980.1 MFS transporter [Acidimicrobiia bacterium]MYJ32822.1 MFS transporter [Acidimicrobiia bacterium]
MAVNTTPSTARSFWPYFVVTGSLSMGYGSLFTLLAEFRDKLGFSETELGFIIAVGFLAGFIAQVGLARFADRGYVWILVHGGVLIALLSMLSMAMTDEVWQFTAARFFLGAGTGATGPAIRRILITRDPPNMGKNLGTMGAFDISGFVLGPVVAGLLAEFINLRAPFLFMAGLYLMIYMWIFRLDLSAGVTATTKIPVRRLFRIRPLNSGMLAGAAFFTTIGVFETSWAVLLDDLGASTLLIALSISLFALPMIPLAPYGGKVAQQKGPMRVMPYSIMGAVVCMLVYGYVEFVWVLIAVSAAHAIFDAFTMPAGQLAIAISAPTEQAAAAQGLFGALGLIIAGIAAVATGAIYENWGAEALFTGASIVMVVALAGAIALGEELMGPGGRSRREQTPASS